MQSPVAARPDLRAWPSRRVWLNQIDSLGEWQQTEKNLMRANAIGENFCSQTHRITGPFVLEQSGARDSQIFSGVCSYGSYLLRQRRGALCFSCTLLRSIWRWLGCVRQGRGGDAGFMMHKMHSELVYHSSGPEVAKDIWKRRMGML